MIDIALGPGIDGFEVCSQFKHDDRYSEAPAVAITAFAKENLEGYETAGFSDYLSKPYSADQLMVILEKNLLHTKLHIE